MVEIYSWPLYCCQFGFHSMHFKPWITDYVLRFIQLFNDSKNKNSYNIKVNECETCNTPFSPRMFKLYKNLNFIAICSQPVTHITPTCDLRIQSDLAVLHIMLWIGLSNLFPKWCLAAGNKKASWIENISITFILAQLFDFVLGNLKISN